MIGSMMFLTRPFLLQKWLERLAPRIPLDITPATYS